jgi:hypothetical protein
MSVTEERAFTKCLYFFFNYKEAIKIAIEAKIKKRKMYAKI